MRALKARALSNFNPCSFVLWNFLLNLTSFDNKSFVHAFKLGLPQTSVGNVNLSPRLQLLERFLVKDFGVLKAL